MRTGDEKIALMYREYGRLGGCKCRSCPHLEAYGNGDCTRTWYKCLMFGTSHGPGTDWRIGNEACGAFKIDPEDAKRCGLYGEVYRRNRGLRREQVPEQLPGQIDVDMLLNGGIQ